MSWCSRPTWWRLTILCCSFPENDLMIFNSGLFCCLDVHNPQNDLMIFNSRLSECLDVSDLPDEDWSSSAVHFLRMIFNSRLSWCLDVPDLPDEDWSPSAVRLVHARGTWKSQFLCCHCCLDLLRAGAGADEEPPSSSTDGWFADALRCRCPYSWAVLLCCFSAFHVSYMYFVLSD